MKKFKFKTSFSGKITKIQHSELDKYVSLAGLEKLKSLMPKDIDLEKNYDLMGAVLNACVGNRANANDDAITNQTMVEIGKMFKYKIVDTEHSRDKIIGVIVNHGFSKFGTDEIISEEEAAKSEEPVNLSLAILIYQSILDEGFIKRIEESADESSENFGSLSASWELFFDDYDIALGTKNVNESTIITDAQEKEKLEKSLRCNGGTGVADGKKVYRVIKSEYLVPAGIGLVEYPAAEVKGLKLVGPVKEDDDEDEDETEEVEAQEVKLAEVFNRVLSLVKSTNIDLDKFVALLSEQCSEPISAQTHEEALAQAISTYQNDVDTVFKVLNVIERSLEEMTKISVTKDTSPMKITNIKDLNDENLKECQASQISEMFDNAIREANEQWKTEKEQKDKEISELNEKNQSLATEHEELKKKVEDLTKQLEALVAEKVAKEQEEQFNCRMAALSDAYELNDNQRKVIAKDIQGLNDEQYKEYSEKLEVMLQKKVVAKVSVAAEEPPKDKVEKTPEEEASVQAAIKNASDAGTQPPNSQTVEENLGDKYRKAFSFENCVKK